MVAAELRSQIAGRLTWQNALSAGTALFAGIGINAAPSVAAQDPVAPLYGAADPFGALAVTSDAPSAQECETLALSPPGNLTGKYESYNIPNDNFYQIQFVQTSLQRCKSQGKLKETAFQQKQELGDGLHPKLEWTPNGLSASVNPNQSKHESLVIRAIHECWPRSTGGYGDLDKLRHREARPALRKTWTPTGGAPAVTKVFTGDASLVCR